MSQGTEILHDVPQTVIGGPSHHKASPQPLGPISNENSKGSTEQGELSEPDLEFSCVGKDYSLIPQGNYEVAFVKAVQKRQFKGFKIFLWFQITEFGPCQGTRLFLPCNLATERTISTRSKYYQNWVLATGRKPDRNERKRMSTRVFKGKLFLAKVATVKKNQGHLPLPPELQYSKIEGLLKRLTD